MTRGGVRLGRRLDERGGRAFLPLIHRLAARIEQLTWEEFSQDPSYAAFALRGAAELFGADALINDFDLALVAEACGGRVARDADGAPLTVEPPDGLPEGAELRTLGRVPAVLETTGRLCAELGERLPVVGVVVGPVTLGRQLGGVAPERAAGLCVELVRAYCELGVGGLLYVESEPVHAPSLASALRPLVNVGRYFEVPSVWLQRRRPVAAAALRDLGLDLIVAGGGEADLVALEDEWLSEPPDDLARRVAALGGRGVTTAWEVPPDVAPETLRRVAALLRGCKQGDGSRLQR